MCERQVWVFHAGALGDFVLTWPLVRAVARGGGRSSGARVTVVADRAKARLVEEWIGVTTERGESRIVGVDGQQRRFTRLWTGDPPGAPDRVEGVERVLAFIADEATEGGRRWLGGAAAMFPGAVVEPVGAVGSGSRAGAWARDRVDELGAATARVNPGGPIVCHVGAGSRAKMWALERLGALVERLRGGDAARRREVVVLAGEVEAERFSAGERRVFDDMGGRFVVDLAELAACTGAAGVFIGADTGPTHLAAQLGVPTVALFGPTDWRVWAPVGPRVRVVAPEGGAGAGMEWLSVEEVERAVGEAQG